MEVLYKRYEQRIYYKAISLLKNKHDAMDLSHDIFIKIFTHLNQFEGRSKFSLWIHTITFNTCMKYLKDKKRISFFALDNQDQVDTSEKDISEKLMLEMDINHIQAGMKELKEDERYVLILKYSDGLKIREMSKILGQSESAIKMKLMRSREKLFEYHQKMNDGRAE